MGSLYSQSSGFRPPRPPTSKKPLKRLGPGYDLGALITISCVVIHGSRLNSPKSAISLARLRILARRSIRAAERTIRSRLTSLG